MYTIFFTINCVKQLIFSKTFVDHLQLEQLIFFCLKVKLLKSSWSYSLTGFRRLSSNNKIVSSRFFKQTNFEQMIMTRLNLQNKLEVTRFFSRSKLLRQAFVGFQSSEKKLFSFLFHKIELFLWLIFTFK